MIAIPNRVRVVVVVSALALAAGLLTLALLAKPTQAQAQSDTLNERVPLALTVNNPCTGEEVFIEGTDHLVFHRTVDANGGFHVKVHSNFEGQGVSPSGAKYVLHTSANNRFYFRAESAENDTFTDTFKIIRQGSATPEADDFELKLTFHVTINANGEVTAIVDKYEAECK
jgi:hypothetical protein